MPSTRSSRKRQTQLNFEPLPASSPARKSQPEAVRDRAAAVTISPRATIVNTKFSGDGRTPSSPAQPFQGSPIGSKTGVSKQAARSTFMSSGVTSKAQRKLNAVVLDDSDVEEEPEPATEAQEVIPSSPPDIQNDSDSDVVLVTPRKRLVTQKPRIEDSEDEQVETPRKRLRIGRKPSPENAHNISEDSVSDNSPVRSSGRLLNRHRKAAEDDTGDEDDEPEVRRVQSTRRAAMEEEDLAEDLEFLSPTSDDGPRAPRASFPTPKRNARSKALEALRKRRSNQAQGIAEQHETQSQSDYADEYEEPSLPILPEHADDDDQDFIVEDDEDGQATALPIEFSHLRSEKPATLFKYVIEWMVQKKLNPGFQSKDDIYTIAFDRLNSFARQMGGSKFQSSVWTPRFLKSLNSRPDITEVRIDGSWRDKCDACNRSGHPATFEMHFSGRKYNYDTLEQDTDDDSESEDEGETYYLGKFCRANAKMAHTFAHWRYHLNTWLVDYLRQENYLDPSKIVERDSWSTKRRQKYANEVVDRMESEGQIKDLYRDFKNSVGDAQDVGSMEFFDSSP